MWLPHGGETIGGTQVGSVRRRGLWAGALVLALVTTGCAGVPRPPRATLPVGFDTVDGTLRVWPPRGGLATDTALADAVSAVVTRWRTPSGDRVHLPSSGILWLGEAGGGRLALVAATVPGDGSSWLLQVAGAGTDLSVTRAVEYPDPGYLVYSDVLPVRLGTDRHYLTSTRVERLTGPDGAPVATTDGLSAAVRVPDCTPVPVRASLRATDSLPRGRAAERLVDLGTAIQDARYPLLGDESDTAVKALDGLDSCALGGEAGPFGSVARRIAGKLTPGAPPASWPIDRVTSRPLGEVVLTSGPPAKLDQLTWRTDSGVMSALVLRPRTGPAVVTRADRTNTLQVYELVADGRSYVALVWRAAPDTSVSVPPGTPLLVDRPGLVVVPKREPPQTFSLATSDKTNYRSLGD
jgi:hypothetical protein